MDREAILALYDRQQRADIEYPEARKEVLPHVVRFIRPPPGMCFVQHSRLDEHTADAEIEAQIAYFAPLGQPFSWKVYDYDTPPDLKERLVAHGFAPDEPGPIMILDLEAAPPALLAPPASQVAAGARISKLSHPGELEDVIGVEEQVWGGNFGWMRQRVGGHMAIPGYISVYVAYVEAQPACAAWIYYYPNSLFAGLFGGSTLPEFRQQGLYTAVLTARVQEAIERGYRFLTIDASPMSRPIVEPHGFQLLTYLQDLEWTGDANRYC